MYLRKLLQTICLPVLLLMSLAALAQNKTVTGRVMDPAGKGIAGASVTLRGQNRGVVTTADGSFSIIVPTNATTLVISSVGYAAQEVSIAARTTADVTLQQAAASLSEVVIVGYGTARKKDLTGSVSTVTAKDFVKGPITTPEQLIAGKVAGVQITSNSGQPGVGSRIRIRGGTSLNASNDPLIVVDGVPLENSTVSGAASALSLINPNDIESITILKDASAAAIYGNRASNGVIIITSKKGTSGKLRVSFSTTNSLSERVNQVEVLSADQFRTLVNARGSAADKALLGNASTNWQDQIYRTAFMTDNNIALSGGVASLPYRLNLGYLNQDGILKRSNLQRATVGLNLTPKFFDNHLAVTANGKYSYSKNFFANQGAIGAAVYFDPTKPVYSDKPDKFGGYYEWLASGALNTLATRNPLGLLNLRDDKSNVNRFIGNVQLDYKLHFLPDLHLNLNAGLDKAHGEGTVYVPAFAASNFSRGGINNQYAQTKTNKLFESYLNYVKDVAAISSRFDVVAGYSWQDWQTTSPAFPDVAANGTVVKPAGQRFQTQNTLVSFYGRLNYSLMSRYLLTATLRRDGSSRFSPDSRWGNFPSAAFAWNIKEEPFLRDNQVLSNLKLRLGWGITGQQDVAGVTGDYPYQPNFYYGDSAARYQFGNTYYTVVRPQAYDASLKWEETEARNVGLDIGFLRNRLTLGIDYYEKSTSNLLAQVPVPAGTNFSNQLVTNVGALENKGLEFSITTNAVSSNRFTLDLNANLTYIIQNKITRLQLINDPAYLGVDVGSIGINGTIQKHAVGYRPNTFFLYKQIYDKSGKPIEGLYEDRNRDGVINDLDKYYGKSPEPKMYAGFSANSTFGKFGAGFTARGSYGNYVYNNVNAGSAIYQNVSSGNNYLNNTTTDILSTNFNARQTWSDYYLENASFIRMDNAYVNYNVGRVIRGMASLRLSLNVQNVFVITKYTGLDPEVNGGIGGTIYPRPRMYALGANLDF